MWGRMGMVVQEHWEGARLGTAAPSCLTACSLKQDAELNGPSALDIQTHQVHVFVRVHFRAVVEKYLLEKSRLVSREKNER